MSGAGTSRTEPDRAELPRGRRGPYGLVGLGPALVAAVGGHQQPRLHLGGPGDDAADGHQVPDAARTHVPDPQRLAGGGGEEVELAAGGEKVNGGGLGPIDGAGKG